MLLSSSSNSCQSVAGGQFLSKCIVHWCRFVLSSELCTKEALVLLAIRNGGHSLTPDFGLRFECPVYLIFYESQKDAGFFQ
jgi:hypothetical protein